MQLQPVVHTHIPSLLTDFPEPDMMELLSTQPGAVLANRVPVETIHRVSAK